MKILGKLLAYPLMAVNIVAALLLIFSCYGSLAAPIGKWPFASLSGLAFPFLYLLNLLFLLFWLITWKKGVLIPLATIIISLGPTLKYFPLHFLAPRQVAEPYLTVITYNTEAFGINDNNDGTVTNPVLNYTMDLDADIILFQEAFPDMMENILKSRDIKSRYPYITRSSGSTGESCMSKYPIVHTENISFEGTSNSCQHVRILIGNDTLAVYNCHLQSNQLGGSEISEYQSFIMHPTDSTHYGTSKKVLKKLLESTSMRAAQARTIAERARRETAKYVIVCGDFNDTPLSYAHSVFNRFMYDAYAKSGVGMGITYHEHNLYYRIDHILCSRNITPLHTRVDRTQKDSDHYPVISKVRLE